MIAANLGERDASLDSSPGAETREVRTMDGTDRKRGGWSWWYLLFVIQCVVVLWPPLYNSVEPAVMGVPFFYWFQLAMLIAGAVLTAIVYFATDN
jgi:Protein of unknown function (DUF3311)